MVILENEVLHIEISEQGAEVRKVICNGKSRSWSGDEKIWSGVSPVLFPICSALREDKYTYNGKEYFMKKHGFIKNQLAKTESKSNLSATFLFKDTPETLKQYPWHFELRITYTVRGNCIDTLYEVKNTSKSTMYYSIGAHESYYCYGGIENYDLIFERKETLYNTIFENQYSCKRDILLKDSNVLPLYENYFDFDSVIFKDVKSRYLTLRNRKTGEEASIKFDGFDFLLLWHKVGAPYICVEPWAGICPSVEKNYEISEKEGILKLPAGETQALKHSVFYEN